MKYILTIILLIGLNISCFGQVISGGVEVSVNQAREEMMSNKRIYFNQKNIHDNLYDPNYLENKTSLLKGITQINDRTLANFSDGSYGIIYNNDQNNVYYYNKDGTLSHNEIRTSTNYPYKSYKYSINGTLVNMSLRTSENETFIFTTTGKLIAHWLGKNCYDENNNIIMTREIHK